MSPAVDGDLYFYGLLLKNKPATCEADFTDAVRVDKGQWRYREACYRLGIINSDDELITEYLQDELEKKALTSSAIGNCIDKAWSLLDRVEACRVAALDVEVDPDGFFSLEDLLTDGMDADGQAEVDETSLDLECVLLGRVPV